MRDQEDKLALDADSDGHIFIKHILDASPSIHAPGGILWMEVDTSHPMLLTDMSFDRHRFLQYKKELYKKYRFVQWKRK